MRTPQAIVIAALLITSACRKNAGIASVLPVAERFALGAHPWYAESAPLGEAAACYAEFPASDVIAIETVDGGTPRPTIVKEGKFSGTCGGKPLLVAFEGVRVQGVRVDQMSGHVGLKSLELEAAHPDWSLSLCAFPLDQRGAKLSTGRGGQGSARWKMRPGCDRVIKSKNFFEDEPPDRGFAWPADSVELYPVHAGTCTLDVDYEGAHGDVTVTVR